MSDSPRSWTNATGGTSGAATRLGTERALDVRPCKNNWPRGTTRELSSAPGPQHPHACWQARVRLLHAADVHLGKPALADVVKQAPSETMEAQDAPGQR